MFWRKKKKEVQPVNLLTLIPERNARFEEQENGKITLLKPRFKTAWIQQRMSRIMKHPDYKIHLDDVGSFVWKQMDGFRNVEEIGRRLKETFGEKVEPVYDRLGEFLAILDRNKFIRLRQSGEDNNA